MRHLLFVLMVCAVSAPAFAADDFGARFQNIEPIAMMDADARAASQIQPAGGDVSDMNSYVQGLFGSDMRGARKNVRIQSQPVNPAKSPIVRIYAEPL